MRKALRWFRVGLFHLDCVTFATEVDLLDLDGGDHLGLLFSDGRRHLVLLVLVIAGGVVTIGGLGLVGGRRLGLHRRPAAHDVGVVAHAADILHQLLNREIVMNI